MQDAWQTEIFKSKDVPYENTWFLLDFFLPSSPNQTYDIPVLHELYNGMEVNCYWIQTVSKTEIMFIKLDILVEVQNDLM
jgi:hypothetical protein